MLCLPTLEILCTVTIVNHLPELFLMKIKTTLIYILLFTSCARMGAEISRVEPAFWWTGMNERTLQLLVHHEDISNCEPKIEYSGVLLQEVVRVENSNYLFLYLDIGAEAESGVFDIEFYLDGQVLETYSYELKARRNHSSEREGFNPSDVIYLIVPDRFSNGDLSNDSIPEMLETHVDRSGPYQRHGGDLRGIINHLPYLNAMGFTALWCTPYLENNQKEQSYHGYAITDFYRIDPRFGTIEDALELSESAKSHGIKLIMDIVLNHCGSGHWWMNDMPMQDWINYYLDLKITNHRRTTNQDPHAASEDAELMTHGWFVDSMPDLNVDNVLLKDYLIQNSIWWVEYMNLSGIRIDTYPYPGKTFMSEWCSRILGEFPNLNIVGEEWSLNPMIISYWQRGKQNTDGYEGNLPSLFDFPNRYELIRALSQQGGSGFDSLYEMLANDFIYAAPDDLVVFLGNHDTSRYLVELGNDTDWARNAMVWLATTRGIPQFYYGDEILMSHPADGGHGVIRNDFPGGWEEDAANAFTGNNLNEGKAAFQGFVKTLLNWRKDNAVLHEGRLTHFAPEKDVYVYFRYDEEDTVMVVLNKNQTPYALDLKRFNRFLENHKSALDVIAGKTITLENTLLLSPKTPLVLDLQ